MSKRGGLTQYQYIQQRERITEEQYYSELAEKEYVKRMEKRKKQLEAEHEKRI